MMSARQRVEDWLDEEHIIRLRDWCRNGATNAQIAERIGISERTLYAWQNRNVQFRNILKEDKDLADAQVENALFKAACEGNTTAMIFWLKNRRHKQWRDKVDVDTNTDALEKLDAMLEKVLDVTADNDTETE